ncbi:MAG: 3-dehydroquinate synthase [Bacillota bacterium]|nr:3-dehydroquinate synthase [Bacillota bacterium]MDW7728579.1 3-dehydroquinate synthase [Bacillota bacterium]
MKGKEIKVKTACFTYRVIIEKNLFRDVGKTLRMLFPSTRALLVSDTKVFSIYGREVLESLESEKWQVETVIIRPGERSKSLAGASRIYDAALGAELDRNSPLIALGGGVVGDLAGFAASTFMRGLPLVMLPTSLLAQVDSCVGGKVAVNHPRGKNLIGSTYPPRIVLIDPDTLKTLDSRQIKAGLAEVIKYGIIINVDFFNWLENNLDYLLQGDSSSLAEAIYVSLKAKALVVEEDEYETDYRRILNFGHTIGHALEAATSYRHYLHGEAVLTGMAAATHLAGELKIITEVDLARILNIIDRVGVKMPPAGLTAAAVIDKLRQDKKRQGDDLIFVLPTAIGRVKMVPLNSRQLIEKAVSIYLG